MRGKAYGYSKTICFISFLKQKNKNFYKDKKKKL